MLERHTLSFRPRFRCTVFAVSGAARMLLHDAGGDDLGADAGLHLPHGPGLRCARQRAPEGSTTRFHAQEVIWEIGNFTLTGAGRCLW